MTAGNRPWRIIPLLAVSALLLGGCRVFRPAPQLELPITDFLPAGWTPTGDLQTINIDGDDSPEYLLFYLYDSGSGDPENPTGPVGALIYDSQPDMQQGVDFKSYRILPKYAAATAHGVVADPGQQANITVRQVARTNPNELSSEPATTTPAVGATVTPTGVANKADELILLGGNTHMTVIWWQNVVDGYGVTQVYAPGGLRDFTYGSGGGTDDAAVNRPVLSVHGFFPLYDRSLLCYQVEYRRALAPDTEPNPSAGAIYRRAVRYEAFPQGLHFCYGTPVHPFYPEGVTLAYLLNPTRESDLWHPALSPEDQDRIYRRLEAIVGPINGPLQVEDLKAYRTVPATAGGDEAQPMPMDTSTCASVLTPQGPRALLVSLRYVPPTAQVSTPDLFFITNIDAIPAPPGSADLACDEIIRDGVPERRWTAWY